MSSNYGFHTRFLLVAVVLGTARSSIPHKHSCDSCILGRVGGGKFRWWSPALRQLPAAPCCCIGGHNAGLVLASSFLTQPCTSASASGALVSQRLLCWSLGPWRSHVGEVNLQEAEPSTNRLGYGNHIQEDWSISQRTPVPQGVSFYYMRIACALGLFCI
jgi:hypothetical protein